MIRLCRESQVQGPGIIKINGSQEIVPKGAKEGNDSETSSSAESGSRSDGGLCFFTVFNLMKGLGDMRSQQRYFYGTL